MRSILHLHPLLVLETMRVWLVAALFAVTHARVSHCPACRTSVRVDDSMALTRRGLMHAECARPLAARIGATGRFVDET